MEGVLLDLGPPAYTGSLSWLLLPNDNLPVVGTRRKDLTKLGMCPGYLPNGACMAAGEGFEAKLCGCMWTHSPLECVATRVLGLSVDNIKHLYRPVGRTGCKTFSVVIELGIMLGGL